MQSLPISLSSRSKIAAAAAASTSLVIAIYERNSRTEKDNIQEDTENDNAASIARADSASWNFYPIKDDKKRLSTICQCEANENVLATSIFGNMFSKDEKSLKRFSTLQEMDENCTKEKSLNESYFLKRPPLGQGAFGAVYEGLSLTNGERVAVKKISKRYTSDGAFLREMEAWLRVRKQGGHPNICMLRENFDETQNDGNYYLVLDLIEGGEMFDHLINNGAFSEEDAARMIREVASALSYLHGIGLVHSDLKPENLMLSTKQTADAVIKVVDFGSATSFDAEEEAKPVKPQTRALTPAYCPPEILEAKRTAPIRPGMDVWALGTILYIMLVGVHPFDTTGQATDDELEKTIKSKKPPPLVDHPYTSHLSDSAIELIQKLLCTDPEKRITADEMLRHPWVKGYTARKDKIEGSDKKLANFKVYKSKLEAKVFEDIVDWSLSNSANSGNKMSLIERSFHSFAKDKSCVTKSDLESRMGKIDGGNAGDDDSLSLTDYSDILAENMKNRFYSKGTVIYEEGDKGDHMYFINSGCVEVTKSDGFTVKLKQGDFFGEGALFHPESIRSGTVKCTLPTHTIQISRPYFEKYLAASATGSAMLNLKEEDKLRRADQAKALLRMQTNFKSITVKNGKPLFKEGDIGDKLYFVEEGTLSIDVDGKTACSINPGDLVGLQPGDLNEKRALLPPGRLQNATVVCHSSTGKQCKVGEMKAADFYSLLDSTPSMKEPLREMSLRRNLQKALVKHTGKNFPCSSDLKKVFDAADDDRSGEISYEEVRKMVSILEQEHDDYVKMTDDDIQELLVSLDLDKSGTVSFDEFNRIFGENKRNTERDQV